MSVSNEFIPVVEELLSEIEELISLFPLREDVFRASMRRSMSIINRSNHDEAEIADWINYAAQMVFTTARRSLEVGITVLTRDAELNELRLKELRSTKAILKLLRIWF